MTAMNAKLTTGGWTEVKDFNTLGELKFEAQGPRHVPVPHDYAINFFKERLAEHNIDIVRETIGFINNNDRTKAFTGLAGTTVYINNAQWFVSDNSFKTRHTTTVKEMLMDRSAHIISWFQEYYQKQYGIILKMKETQVSDTEVGKLILNYIREKYILSSTNIKRIVEEWDNPRYEEFKPRTLWSLQNACAEVFKKIKSPLFRLQAFEVFHETFNIN